jgi:hypothetical protein
MHPSEAKAPSFPALDGMAKAMPLQSMSMKHALVLNAIWTLGGADEFCSP